MIKLDQDFIRSQFPAFSEPSLEGFAHFENAGGSYLCGPVIERLNRYHRETRVQPYYGFTASRIAGEQMDQARVRLASWLNLAPEEIHFGPSTSQNTYVVAQALRQHLKPGDEVVVTNQDHEANIGVWRRLETEGIVIREWQVDPDSAELEESGLDNLLNERTRVVAFTHCSNIVGSVNPVREWTDRIHAAGAIAIVDGVSYAGHGLPDVEALGADIYLLSLYKVYGPHIGVMAMRKALNRQLPDQCHFFNAEHTTARFTPAGPDHAQIAAVNGVIDYFESVYAHHFKTGHFENEHFRNGQFTDGAVQAECDPPQKASAVAQLFQQAEHANLALLLDFLSQKKDVRLIGRASTQNRAPTVALTVKGRDPEDIAAELAAQKIGIGNGNCYAYRLMQALGIPPVQGVVRLSFVHYTTNNELTRLIRALDKIL